MELNEQGQYVVDRNEQKQWDDLFKNSKKNAMMRQKQENLKKFYNDFSAYF